MTQRKALLVLFMSSFLLFSLLSCAPQPVEETTEEAAEEPTEEAMEEPTEEAMEEPAEETSDPSDIGRAVAILVVDDFVPDRDYDAFLEALPNLAQQNSNCVVTPDGQANYASEGAANYASEGAANYASEGAGDLILSGVPHGWLVLEKIRNVLGRDPEVLPLTQMFMDMQAKATAGQLPLGPGDVDDLRARSGLSSIWVYGRMDDQHLIVAAVDSGGFDTGLVADRIPLAAEAIRHADLGVEEFVLNLSFAVVPCDELQPDLTEYQNDLESNKDLAAMDEALRNVYGEVSENAQKILQSKAKTRAFYDGFDPSADPAERQAATNSNGEDRLFLLTQDSPIEAIIVASSGNNGQDFPYAPALWPGVLSVGGDPSYANDSEIVLDDLVEISPELIETINNNSFSEILVMETDVVQGTSFSAPEMSIEAAHYLLRGGSGECESKTLGSLRPPMAYAGNQGPWQNLDLEAAVGEHCPTFFD